MSPEEVREALTHKCDMCKAQPGEECLSIIDGKPLRESGDRPCHYYRRETK